MKKAIIIKKENEERIKNALNEVHAKCTVRTINYEAIEQAINKILKKFNLPKSHLNGCTFTYRRYADDVPQAYKYVYNGTIIKMTVKNGNFQLIDCYRGNCNHVKEFECELTESCKKDIIYSYTKWDR